MSAGNYVVLAVIGSLISNPASAAGSRDFAFTSNDRESSTIYVGATISFTGNKQKGLAPSFALDAGARRWAAETRHSPAMQSRAPLLVLQPGPDGAKVRLGSRLLSEGDAGIDAGTILLALAAAAGAAFLVSEIADSDKDRDDDQCMIEPELCD